MYSGSAGRGKTVSLHGQQRAYARQLLALNANIEVTRAGGEGDGFAVVVA